MAFRIDRQGSLVIEMDGQENSAVRIAAENLKEDVERIFRIPVDIWEGKAIRDGEAVRQTSPFLNTEIPRERDTAGRESIKEGGVSRIRIHTAGESPQAGQDILAETEKPTEKEKLLPLSEEGKPCKEGFVLRVDADVLYIVGADRRGTIYGIYELAERLGVSPWRFFADVPDRPIEEFSLEEGFIFADYPSVEYRGVFINDEEELENWVKLHMGEDTIGVKTYEKIFELILRLKGNYIWPAMHVNSFNSRRENGELADRMGIVVGTSHCDMLMRSNNREWWPWIEKKGYKDVEYDYSIPGRNREILDEYWRESVQQNKDFEVGYTLGMRGIHDSGFETKSLKGLEGKALLQAKIELLETVIRAQEKILSEELGEKDAHQLKTFVPYKEVLELYDNGLEVPDELTLIWANDNYGHIRRYPGEKERKRKGGNGIYYHNSYWAPPGASYLFTKSIPIPQTRNELQKAWNEGIRKLWVLNIGALKPLETEISFYLRFAWEIGKNASYAEKSGYLTASVEGYLTHFYDAMFSDGAKEEEEASGIQESMAAELWQRGKDTGNQSNDPARTQGERIARLMIRWAQLTNVRKVEQLDSDVFSQYAYGNEASERMLGLRDIMREADGIYRALPEEEKDSFFQIVLWRIHASYISNAAYYYADRSAYCNQNGAFYAAGIYAERSIHYDRMRRKLLYYYGNVQVGGKWSGMVTPEDFPPPRTAMYPAYVFPLEEGTSGLIVKCFEDDEKVSFTDRGKKWITLFSAREEELVCSVEVPDYLKLYSYDTENGTLSDERYMERPFKKIAGDENRVGFEKRLILGIREDASDGFRRDGDEIVITCEKTGEVYHIPVNVDLSHEKEKHHEDCGMICCEAADYVENTGWIRIPDLGRGYGDLMESSAEGQVLSYGFFLATEGAHTLELHRFPSLNSTGVIQVYVRVDDGEEMLLKTEANDEHRGNWKENVRDSVDRLCLRLPELKAGRHTITFRSDGRYFSFSRWVIYTAGRKENMLGRIAAAPELYGQDYFKAGEHFFYEDGPMTQRPVIYAPLSAKGNSLVNEDMEIDPAAVREWTIAGSVGKPGWDEKEAICEESESSTDLSERIARTRKIMQDIVAGGSSIFTEKDGKLLIEAGTALAQTEFAHTCNGRWDYCGGFSHGGRGIAMHVRKPGIIFREKYPALEYRLRVSDGDYMIWILMKYNSYDHAGLHVLLDGEEIPKEKGQDGILRKYSAEQVYRWVPFCRVQLGSGEHSIRVGLCTTDMRIDSICLMKGEELPGVPGGSDSEISIQT